MTTTEEVRPEYPKDICNCEACNTIREWEAKEIVLAKEIAKLQNMNALQAMLLADEQKSVLNFQLDAVERISKIEDLEHDLKVANFAKDGAAAELGKAWREIESLKHDTDGLNLALTEAEKSRDIWRRAARENGVKWADECGKNNALLLQLASAAQVLKETEALVNTQAGKLEVAQADNRDADTMERELRRIARDLSAYQRVCGEKQLTIDALNQTARDAGNERDELQDENDSLTSKLEAISKLERAWYEVALERAVKLRKDGDTIADYKEQVEGLLCKINAKDAKLEAFEYLWREKEQALGEEIMRLMGGVS